MKLKVGIHSNSLQVFDDDGNEITDSLMIAELDISLRPNSAVQAKMLVYVDDVEIDMYDGCVETVHKSRDRS